MAAKKEVIHMAAKKKTAAKKTSKTATKTTVKRTKSARPLKKIVKFNVEPHQSFARMAVSMVPPEGYQFYRMDRKGTKATVTYIKY